MTRLAAALVAAGLALTACAGPGGRASTATATSAATSATSTPAAATSGASADARAAEPAATPDPTGPAPLPSRVAVPVRLEVPAIRVSAPLDTLRLGADGELEKPPHWDRPGWYSGGAVPGEPGPAVIAGHVDSPTGPAVFWRLRELARGDRITVRLSDGTAARFDVTRVEQAAKDAFPSAEVYGPTPDRELRLITCAGVYDKGAGGYRDNRIVFAVAT
ncbi:LPXTG-site transpeptidase (sortase) family protein [Motilibacter peucedani]|uniref:LPXTG-site transpeptidase (Sortase) family protein n=1 Tax=Motilibacter peucedani TaxID=598650 RepID=A0A420XM49_9ACTN|nr:class F sortase [Motilibacter peucedani]RKS71310.1 LPXTG-site transpeptidase (sortase) family protein [Motilibacter peucedani]